MTGFARFLKSLVGRIALLLAFGTMLAVAVALLIAEAKRDADFNRIQSERVLASAVDILSRLRRDPDRTMAALADDQIIGALLIRKSLAPLTPDASLSAMLAERTRLASPTDITRVGSDVCTVNTSFWRKSRTAGISKLIVPDCWLLSIHQPGQPVRIGLALPKVPRPPSTLRQPSFLLLVALSCIGLSLLAARLATAPLRRLASASRAFARSIDAEPVAEAGPTDVREALATFNLMQERVREGLRERTRLLAGISHDLQTPLTRLRLRLEQVEDATLRERLLGDLSATLAMVRRGLDLARGGESAEEWSTVDLDSLLSSMADDATEVGQPVRFAGGCGARVRVKVDALTRCLGNLIDNAVKYGGSAEITCSRQRREVLIDVRDRGPGMAPGLLARAFEPFVRGDVGRSAGDGTGIGLAIARAQAGAIGATLTLANHPDGGLVAVLRLPLASNC